jgi:sulfite exporter TauE/SafE/copper chaperone CopZ
MEENRKQIILHVDGMSCTGCETRIENAVEKLEGVNRVKAIYSSSNVYISYDDNKIELIRIIETIEKLDYRVIKKPSDSMIQTEKHKDQHDDGIPDQNSDNKINIVQIVGIGVIILALYLIINNTIGFNFIPQVNQSMGYGLLFFAGLLTSLHCVAMCGGINLSVCVQYNKEDEKSRFAKLRPGILYNLGRVVSYTAIGGIVGAIGSVISFSGTMKGVVSVISGIFMVIMGLNMMNIFPWLRKLNPRLPKFLGKKVHNNTSKKGPFVVGLLNGLMSCGPLKAMQIYALGTGNFFVGTISMFIFSIGTVPLMFGFSAVSSIISGKFTHRMMKLSAVLVMVLGIFMVNRGLNLSGLGFVSSSQSSIAKIENGVQLVSTELEPGGYSPIIVQKGIPVKWTINVEKGDLNGCNNPVVIPELNKQIKLKTGENIIEFEGGPRI